MKSRQRTLWLLLLAVVVLAVLAFPLFSFQVCTDRAFVDETTGSRRGYREWLFGTHSGEWYKESALETFIRTNQPTLLRQRWTSFAGTGRNVFGGAISAGHGRPGAVLMLAPENIAEYCVRASEAEKRRLYDTLSAGDQPKIRQLASEVLEKLVDDMTRKTGPFPSTNGSQPFRLE